jgi:hypothetical protein
MSKHQRYQEHELDVIKVEWGKGTPIVVIAKLLDRDPIALASRTSRMGLPERRKRTDQIRVEHASRR